MKKLYATIFVLAATLSSEAQLTQATHAPAAGDTYEMWDCGTNANPGASGAGVTWNFSSLTTNSNVSLSYTASATTNTNYPNANVSVVASASNTSHYKSSAGSLLYYGGNIAVGTAVAGTMTYTLPAVEAVYPLSLNTTSTANTSGTMQVTVPFQMSGSFTGNSRFLADGTGTLILPGGGTYTNVLRVLTQQTLNISAGSAPFTTTASVVQEMYSYYAAGIKAPVLTLATSTAVVAGGAPNTQTMVARNKNAPGVPTGTTITGVSAVAQPEMQVFPNPVTGDLYIVAGSSDAASVAIYDLTGKLVATSSLRDGKSKIDVSGYQPGLYIYSIKSADNKALKTGRITVNP